MSPWPARRPTASGWRLHHLAPEAGWVLSGINPGGNLGTDIHHSGTVAAVREAVIHGVPGIAISHYIARGRPIDWTRGRAMARETLVSLMARAHGAGTFWNVNLPHLGPDDPDPEVVFCPLDPSPLPLSYRFEDGQAVYAGDYQSRIRRPGYDVDVCFGGQIAVTSIHVAGGGIGLTEAAALARGGSRLAPAGRLETLAELGPNMP